MTTALLLSGGIDSIALAYWVRPEFGVTVDYGQKPARTEMQAAAQVCEELGIEHVSISLGCDVLGSGDMAGKPALPIAPVPEWWPFRNQFLVTVAAQAVLPRGATRLLLGCVSTDAAHADGSPRFVEALTQLLEMQEGGLSLEAPAIEMTSAELVKKSSVPIEVLSWAHSCHVSNFACGRCRGCFKHYTTLRDLGVRPY